MKNRLMFIICLAVIFEMNIYNLNSQWVVLPVQPVDNSGVINTSLDSHKAVTLEPNKDYQISSTIYVGARESLHIPSGTRLIYSGTSIAVEIDELGYVFGGGTIISFTECIGTSGIGVRVVGSDSRLDISEITGFLWGVYLYGFNRGCAYNDIKVQKIQNCKIAVYLNAVGTGWVNQNYLKINRICIKGCLSNSGTYGIYIDSENVHEPNGNHFSGSIENVEKGVHLTGDHNRFEGLRLELHESTNRDYITKIEISKTTYGSTPMNNAWFGENGSWNWNNEKDILWIDMERNFSALVPYGFHQLNPPVKVKINDDTQNGELILASFEREYGTTNRNIYSGLSVIKDNNARGTVYIRGTGSYDYIPKLAFGVTSFPEVLTIQANGKAVINSTDLNSQYDLSIGGFTGGLKFIEYSDSGILKDVDSIDNPISLLMQITGQKYKYVEDKNNFSLGQGYNYGFVAQDIVKIIPELVFKDSTQEYSGINYSGFIPLLVESIKEHQRNFEQQQDKMTELIGVSILQQSIISDLSSDVEQQKYVINKLEEDLQEKEVRITDLYILNQQNTDGISELYEINDDQEKGISELYSIIEKDQEKIAGFQKMFLMQENKIIELYEIIEKLSVNKDIQPGRDYSKPEGRLSPVIPNPANLETSVTYFVPENSLVSFIIITDFGGRQLNTYSIINKGSSELKIQTDEFETGIYLISLIIDNIVVDTETMVIQN